MYVYRAAWVILVAALMVSAPHAFAVKMDETTHDLVIERLELAIKSMAKSDPELAGVQARLGDLYSDRARLKALNELSGHCQTDCKASRADRRRAIELYNEALAKIDKSQQGKITLQVAHLYSLNEQPDRAIALYKKIINAKRSQYVSQVRGLALASLGEIHFKKADFQQALKFYESARREDLVNKAVVEYRLAWCRLNLGQVARAITTLTTLLENPELLATPTTDGKAVDPSFVQDVSNDLARFLARGTVGQKQIELLKSLSPESARKQNIKTLAEETDRLGKKSAALAAWAAYVDEGQVSGDEKIEVQTRIAQIHYDMNHQREAAAAFARALTLWKEHGCKTAEPCEDLKSRLRRFVTSWHKAQGDRTTEPLFKAYAAYAELFADAQMYHWGAQVGAAQKKYREAAHLFRQAAVQAQADLKAKPDSKDSKNIFEGSLLGEIEMAEAAKDDKARESAYNYYLSVNANGQEATKVRYQRAQLYYASNRPKDALTEFHYLASMPGPDRDGLKVKSADLALDALVALKDDLSLQVRGLEYARLFPARKTEYLKISRNATMNIVAANMKSARADFKANLAALNQVNLDGADDQERIRFHKNKIVIAQKAMDLAAVEGAAGRLLAVKALSDKDREWALAQKVWVAELQLNFEKSYRITRTMELKHLSPADRELRLALLADLAGLDSRRHNEAFLKLTKNIRAGNLVRVTLIKSAKSPWRELNKHLSSLRRTPDLLAGIALETFARERNNSQAKNLLETTAIGKFPAGVTLARHLEMKDFKNFDRKIGAHRLYGYSDKAMQKTIGERLKLLAESERWAQKALKRQDWTLQILTLQVLARENRRLNRDIMSLPVPQRLDAEQKRQYLELLKKQSDPYLARADKLEAQIQQMWNSSNSVQNLQAAYMTATPDLQKLYRDEITVLATLATGGAEKRLRNLLNTPFRRPSQKDILLARKELQSNPFDISKAKSLRELEAQIGRPSMVVYLDERISQLKAGKSL